MPTLCGLCGIDSEQHSDQHLFSKADPGQWAEVLELLRLAGVPAYQSHQGGNVWAVQLDLDTAYALLTRAEEGVGYYLGVYQTFDQEQIEVTVNVTLSEAIVILKGWMA